MDVFSLNHLYHDLNISVHMTDDPNPIQNPSNVSVMATPYPLFVPNPPSNGNNKKDDSHIFLYPSCIDDSHRRVQDTCTISSNNVNNNLQLANSVRVFSKRLYCNENKKKENLLF